MPCMHAAPRGRGPSGCVMGELVVLVVFHGHLFPRSDQLNTGVHGDCRMYQPWAATASPGDSTEAVPPRQRHSPFADLWHIRSPQTASATHPLGCGLELSGWRSCNRSGAGSAAQPPRGCCRLLLNMRYLLLFSILPAFSRSKRNREQNAK